MWSVNKFNFVVNGAKSTRGTIIHEDNQGAIALTDNPMDHPRTKHIAVRYHAIRDMIQNNEVEVRYLPTQEMVADCLTKSLDKTLFDRLVGKLGMKNGGPDDLN